MSFGGGSGGGSGSIAGSSDVNLNNVQNEQVLSYDSSSSKWQNRTISTSGAMPGEVALDSFSGADDDAKLAAAMSYAGAQTHPPVIRLSNRQYTFQQSIVQPYDSFALVGPNDAWLSSAASKRTGCEVHVDITPRSGEPAGYFIELTGEAWNLNLSNIYFTGTSQTQFMRAAGQGAGQLHASTLHSLQFNNFRSVLGNSNEPMAVLLCIIDGYWSVQYCYDTAISLRGSDCRGIFTDGCNIDSAALGNGKYHVILSYLSKSNVGPMYVNCDDDGWRGVLVLGNETNGNVNITGAIIEGRNTSNPCFGQLVRVEGGSVVLRDCVIDCGMKSPGADDKGLVCAVGATVAAVLDGVTFQHAAGVDPATTACVYAEDATVHVKSALGRQRSGGPAFNGNLPLVQKTATATVRADTSVTVTSV